MTMNNQSAAMPQPANEMQEVAENEEDDDAD